MDDIPNSPIQDNNTYDVFISYAQTDNQPFLGEKKGWISTFVENFENIVNRKRRANCKTWMDIRDLQRNKELSEELKVTLKHAKVLLIFTSKSYLNSTWCKKERDFFYECAGKNSGRLFFIELDELNLNEKPDSIKNFIPYCFWKKTNRNATKTLGLPQLDFKNDEGEAYVNEITNLSQNVVQKLEELNYKATVYLAPVVSDSLRESRKAIKTDLQQNNIKVLPEDDAMPINLQNSMKDDLQNCSYFIQLLNNEYNGALPLNQYAIAKKHKNIKIIQWRDYTLNINESIEYEHQFLLRKQTVIATNRVDFQIQLIKNIFPPKENQYKSEVKSGINKYIFINTSIEDIQCAEKIAATLIDAGFGIRLLDPNQNPEKIRKQSEAYMLNCDIMLILQRKSSQLSIQKKLEDIDPINFQRNKNNYLQTYVCRPTEAPILYYWPKNNTVLLRCNKHYVWEDCVKKFIKGVRNVF